MCGRYTIFTPPDESTECFTQRGRSELRAYPVSRAVHSPANDDPALVTEAAGV